MITFEPRDLWVGAYWTWRYREHWNPKERKVFDLYICVIPCFPVHLTWSRQP
jgi:hypothetical protein